MVPLKLCQLGIAQSFGMEMVPTHEMRISASLMNNSPEGSFRSVTSQRALFSDHSALATSHSVVRCCLTPNLSTVSLRYCKISACSAKRFVQSGLGLNEKEYKCESTSQPTCLSLVTILSRIVRALARRYTYAWICVQVPCPTQRFLALKNLKVVKVELSLESRSECNACCATSNDDSSRLTLTRICHDDSFRA